MAAGFTAHSQPARPGLRMPCRCPTSYKSAAVPTSNKMGHSLINTMASMPLAAMVPPTSCESCMAPPNSPNSVGSRGG